MTRRLTPPNQKKVDAAMAFNVYDLAPWEDSLRDQNDPAQWQAFRPALEISLHNTVHRYLGGNMKDIVQQRQSATRSPTSSRSTTTRVDATFS